MVIIIDTHTFGVIYSSPKEHIVVKDAIQFPLWFARSCSPDVPVPHRFKWTGYSGPWCCSLLSSSLNTKKIRFIMLRPPWLFSSTHTVMISPTDMGYGTQSEGPSLSLKFLSTVDPSCWSWTVLIPPSLGQIESTVINTTSHVDVQAKAKLNYVAQIISNDFTLHPPYSYQCLCCPLVQKIIHNRMGTRNVS